MISSRTGISFNDRSIRGMRTSQENLLSQVLGRAWRTLSPRLTTRLSFREREQILDGHTEEPSQPQSKFQGRIVAPLLHGNYGLSSHLDRIRELPLSQLGPHSKSPYAVLQGACLWSALRNVCFTLPYIGFAVVCRPIDDIPFGRQNRRSD